MWLLIIILGVIAIICHILHVPPHPFLQIRIELCEGSDEVVHPRVVANLVGCHKGYAPGLPAILQLLAPFRSSLPLAAGAFLLPLLGRWRLQDPQSSEGIF